jgi:glycosyltransferase involved in cell wall biosynthesis
VICVIPSYNEGERLIKTISGIENLLDKGLISTLIIVNDGSTDNTNTQLALFLQNSPNKHKFVVLNHCVNLGVGAAIKTSFEYLKLNEKNDPYVVITMDADGQHLTADVEKIVHSSIFSSSDLIIGARKMSFQRAPLTRVLSNTVADILTSMLAQKKVIGSQSGLRAFSSKAIKTLVLKARGYATCSETIINSHKLNLVVKHIDIEAVYTNESIEKGQKISNALNVLKELLSIV